jgi:hypothetical protein
MKNDYSVLRANPKGVDRVYSICASENWVAYIDDAFLRERFRELRR